jgi:hypothetical protein
MLEPTYATELLAVVDRAAPELLRVPGDAAARRPGPGKWSAKEIIGHLIDSAANNHARFVRASREPDLVCAGYAQDDWVRDQDYQSAPWPDLVALWSAYNRHLARVMAVIPTEARTRERRQHNLDQIGWRALPAGEPATLDFLMRDYVGHLKHHLAQIACLLPAVSPPASS